MIDQHKKNNTETLANDDESKGLTSANFVLVVLLLAYILSFIDRNILALLVGPIREHFAISDFQFSLLHGLAFTLFYIFLGLPIGWLADRYSRKWIITGGVFFWSVMTCACGFAKNFSSLFITRIGVGVGEATLSPATYSILGDYFSAQRLRWATAVFGMGITLGTGLSYMVGGWMYETLLAMDTSQWPLVGGLHAWQLTFIFVGLPGLLVVLLLLFISEPPRRGTAAVSAEQALPTAVVVAYLRQHWQAYSALMVGASAMAVIGYGTMIWFPEFLLRTYQLNKSEGGAALGSIFLLAGSSGTFAGAWFASLLQKRGYVDANLRWVMITAILLAVPATVLPLLPDSTWALALSVPVIFLHYSHFGVVMAGLQLMTPSRMRGQVSALLLFMTNLFGLALGGSLVAFITDFVFADDLSLRYSLAIVAAIFYPLTALAIGLGLRHYRRALAH